MTSPYTPRLLAVCAAAATASFLACGSAAAADTNPTVTTDGAVHTIKIVSHTTKETYTPKGGTATSAEPTAPPKTGDAFNFVDDLTQGGTKVGTDDGTCTVTGENTGHCVVAVTFPNGTLSVEGSPNFAEENTTSKFMVVGGTGAFAGAKGFAMVKDVNDKDSDITVTYTTDGSAVPEPAVPVGGANTGDGSTAGQDNPWLVGFGVAAAAAGAVGFVGARRLGRRGV